MRVLYADTDKAGVVHHAAYLRFFEAARVELLRSRGIDYRRFEIEVGKGLPVTEIRVKYRAPARFDDDLTIETVVGVINRAKIRFDSRLFRAGALLSEAEITCACVTIRDERICSMDPMIRSAFE